MSSFPQGEWTMESPRAAVSRSFVLWSVWIAVLLAWTAALLTTLPVEIKEELFSPDLGFSAGKALHITVYAGLAGFGLLLPSVASWRWLPVAILSLHALATEWVQPFVGRTGCWEDVMIDHVGIVVGVALAAGFAIHCAACDSGD